MTEINILQRVQKVVVHAASKTVRVVTAELPEGLPNTGGGGGTAPTTLDALTDVVAPANTPSGKLLGTTSVGEWGPVDPPPVTIPPLLSPLLGGSWASLNPVQEFDPSTLQFKFVAETAVVTLDAAGAAYCFFPAVFPGGVMSVLAISGFYSGRFVEIADGGWGRDAFLFRALDINGAPVAGAFRINYLVIGW